MKNFLFTLAAGLCLSLSSFGQDYYAAPTPQSSSVYLGLGTGINNYLGMLGPSIEYRFAPKFSAFGGAGLGSWGNKISIGARYYADFPGHWAFGLGYSHASGLETLELDMDYRYVVGQSATVRVPFRLKGANTVNLSANRYWMIGRLKRNRFNIELGYAVPVAENRYTIKNNYELTPDGKYFMNVMQPGGINLGFGFSFALN